MKSKGSRPYKSQPCGLKWEWLDAVNPVNTRNCYDDPKLDNTEMTWTWTLKNHCLNLQHDDVRFSVFKVIMRELLCPTILEMVGPFLKLLEGWACRIGVGAHQWREIEKEMESSWSLSLYYPLFHQLSAVSSYFPPLHTWHLYFLGRYIINRTCTLLFWCSYI